MNKEKIFELIDECKKEMKFINENFSGYDKIRTQEKEENFYKTKFDNLNITPRIVSQIYTNRNDENKIQEIKDNIDKYLIH